MKEWCGIRKNDELLGRTLFSLFNIKEERIVKVKR